MGAIGFRSLRQNRLAGVQIRVMIVFMASKNKKSNSVKSASHKIKSTSHKPNLKTTLDWSALKKGDIVDIVAPGFATTPEKLQAGVNYLASLGLRPRTPQDIFGADVVAGNTDEKRLQHLVRALTASDSKAIWCARGGYGAIRLIEAVAKLKKPNTPKLFIGYSDACTIHNFLNQVWKWPTLHGPLVDRLGEGTLPQDHVRELNDIVFGRATQVEFAGLTPLNKAAEKSQTINASMAGGNLTVTQSHLGTKFARVPQNQILFFEDIGERGYRVDRILKQLQMAGYLKKTRAVIFAEFYRCDEPGPEKVSKVPGVLKRFAEEMKIPVLRGLPIGHGDQQRPMPLATPAQLICGPNPLLIVQARAKK